MHDVAPACVIVNAACPETVMLPDLGRAEKLGDTEKEIVPLVVPVAPAVMDIQGSLPTADQLQPGPDVTVKPPEPPFAETEKLVGDMENVQPTSGT